MKKKTVTSETEEITIDNKKKKIQNDQIPNAYQPLNKVTMFFI